MKGKPKNSAKPQTACLAAAPSWNAPLWLISLNLAYAAFLAVLTILNYCGADRWWPGAFNLYLPQLIWTLPGIFLVAATFRAARRWAWLPLLGVLWVAGPLMGLCWPLSAPEEQAGGLPLRVMTWNVKYGTHDKLAHLELMHDIDRHNPTVVLMQDAGGVMNGVLGDYFKKWNVRYQGQYVMASRLPLAEAQLLSLSGRGSIQRSRVRLAGTEITIYNVHLESPRDGLNAVKDARKSPEHLPAAAQKLESNVETRFIQARSLREYLRRESGPVIVAGDLNSTDSSQVCSMLRDAGLHDAFAEGGRGYGYTYGHFLLRHRLPAVNYSWMRIDHIMISSRLQARRCWTGSPLASDHRPVIADLMLKP